MPGLAVRTMVDVDASHQGEYQAQSIAMTALGLFFVILRFAARWKKSLPLWWDDYMMILALVFLFATCGLNLAMIHFGMGRHADVLTEADGVKIAKLLIAFECVYCTTVGIIKISILLMYARIFPSRGFRIAAIVIGSIAIAWVIAIICVSVFQCNPIAKAWHTSLPGTCIDLKGSFIGNGVPNIVTDIAILSLPVHVVWGLHATLTHRLSVIGIFLLGSFVVFASAYRFSTLFKFEPADTPWTLAKPCTWCLIECSSGIISACLPTLRPLFVMISSKFSSTLGTSRNRTTDSKGTVLKSFEGNKPVLRPSGEYLSKQNVRLDVSHPDDAYEDHVPLNIIRVRRDITWREDEVRC